MQSGGPWTGSRADPRQLGGLKQAKRGAAWAGTLASAISKARQSASVHVHVEPSGAHADPASAAPRKQQHRLVSSPSLTPSPSSSPSKAANANVLGAPYGHELARLDRAKAEARAAQRKQKKKDAAKEARREARRERERLKAERENRAAVAKNLYCEDLQKALGGAKGHGLGRAKEKEKERARARRGEAQARGLVPSQENAKAKAAKAAARAEVREAAKAEKAARKDAM